MFTVKFEVNGNLIGVINVHNDGPLVATARYEYSAVMFGPGAEMFDKTPLIYRGTVIPKQKGLFGITEEILEIINSI